MVSINLACVPSEIRDYVVKCLCYYLILNTLRDNCTIRVIKRRPALVELFNVLEDDVVKTVTSGYHMIRFGCRILSAMEAALFTTKLKIL